MRKEKNLKSFLKEEDWRTIKKSLLVASLWLVTWFLLTWSVDAWSHWSSYNHHSDSDEKGDKAYDHNEYKSSYTWISNKSVHASWFYDLNSHSSTHTNHSNHSSY